MRKILKTLRSIRAFAISWMAYLIFLAMVLAGGFIGAIPVALINPYIPAELAAVSWLILLAISSFPLYYLLKRWGEKADL